MASDSKQVFLASIEKAYGRQLRRYLAARLRNAAADTHDLMQEVYVRLLRIDDYDTIRNPQAYIYTIASHVLQQHALKQAGLMQVVIDAGLNFEISTAACVDPASELEAEQSLEDMERSLRTLSPRAYTTLILSRCHGMPLQEIGAQMGVSRAQVKKYLAKALIHVRERMQQTNKETP